jgi:uncharacterized Zn-binding protein involved in type VI secretion
MSTPSDSDDDDPWLEGPVVTTKEDADDDTYVEGLPGTVDGEGPQIDGSLWDAELELELGSVEVEGSIADVHLQWDLDTEDHDAPDVEKEWVRVTIGPKPPMMATLGSPLFHGGVLGPGPGSPNVYAEGKPVWRSIVDLHVCPAATPNPHGAGPVVHTGPPPRVFVNGFPVARAGDAVLEAAGGPNPIMFGASSVWAGQPAPPVTTVNPVPRITVEEEPWYGRVRKWIVDVDLEAEVGAEGRLAPGTHRVSGGAMADPLDEAWGANAKAESAGEIVHGKARARAELKGTLFGRAWNWTPIDWEKEGGRGRVDRVG